MKLNRNQETWLKSLKKCTERAVPSLGIERAASRWNDEERAAFIALSPREEWEVLEAYAKWGLREEAEIE